MEIIEEERCREPLKKNQLRGNNNNRKIILILEESGISKSGEKKFMYYVVNQKDDNQSVFTDTLERIQINYPEVLDAKLIIKRG